MIAETGFAYTGGQFEPDYEFDVSQAGQQQFMEAIVNAVQSVPGGMGMGVFWWYAEARPVSGFPVWENGRYGLFDQTGNLLPAASVYEQFLPTFLLGDANGDGIVDRKDLLAVEQNYPRCAPPPPTEPTSRRARPSW